MYALFGARVLVQLSCKGARHCISYSRIVKYHGKGSIQTRSDEVRNWCNVDDVVGHCLANYRWTNIQSDNSSFLKPPSSKNSQSLFNDPSLRNTRSRQIYDAQR